MFIIRPFLDHQTEGLDKNGYSLIEYIVGTSFFCVLLLSFERTCFDKGRRWYWSIGIPFNVFGLAMSFGYKLHIARKEETRLRLEAKIDKLIDITGTSRPRASAIVHRYRKGSLTLEDLADMIWEREFEDLLSELVDIAGVSDKKARTLLDQFPRREDIQGASIQDLSAVSGIGKSIATAIKIRIGT